MEVRNIKRYGNIYEKIYDIENLKLAHKNARKDKTYYKEVKMVDANEDYYLSEIQKMLKKETYEVSTYEISVINDKGKERELCKLPYYPDRIIQWAIMLQVEHIFMQVFPTGIRGIDFVGYRHFYGYKLLRKSTCKRLKKQMLKIKKKCSQGHKLNYSDWCSANSYKGWLICCNSYRLSKKYIEPIQAYLDEYYQKQIKERRVNSYERYGNKAG